MTQPIKPVRTVEELMRPRYKVVATWPGSEHTKGDIIDYWETGYYNAEYFCKMYDEYPDCYRKMFWWEERSPEDMEAVKYLKFYDPHWVKPEYKIVQYWNVVCGNIAAQNDNDTSVYTLWYYKYNFASPCSESEYTEQDYTTQNP